MSIFQRRRRRRTAGAAAVDTAGDVAETAACCCIVNELFDSDPCFVATASYGSDTAPEVVDLRRYRDEVLVKRPGGRAFTSAYYRFGPIGARALHGRPHAKRAARAALRPAIAHARRRLRAQG